MHSVCGNDGCARQARKYRKRQRDNAAWRACVGAMLRLGMPVKPRSLHDAATDVGSTPTYVNAMKVLIEANQDHLIAAVLAGRVPLLDAAAHARRRMKTLS